MAKRLTEKQKKFCELLVKNPTIQGATDAYHQAYDCLGDPDTIRRSAMRLRKNPLVMEYMQELTGRIAEGYLSKKEHMDKLAELRDLAVQDGAYGAAFSFEDARGKVAGLHTELKQIQVNVVFSWAADEHAGKEKEDD